MIRVNKYILAVPFIALLLLTVLGGVSIDSYAKGAKAKGPKCKYVELGGTKIITFNCDRFQSKGDKDSITPQIKIVEPLDGEEILASDLGDITNEAGEVVGKFLPITVVVSPEFVVDFTLASSAVTQYLFLPQEDGVGHAHAYISPAIEVDLTAGEVEFVGSDNRSDFTGGFCVFRLADEINEDYQVFSVECPLQAFESMEDGIYNVSVDFTEHSHGPRMKNHPRDVPPFDKITIDYTNDLVEE